MQVQDIYIYPVKSLGGIKLPEAIALERGFESDRRLMLVDANGRFISQRSEHQLALLQTELTSSGLTVYHKHKPEHKLEIIYKAKNQQSIVVSVWDDEVRAKALDERYNDWFSRYLGKTCKLVFMPENTPRPVDERFALNKESVSFADAFPYLLITQASLNDLNNRLQAPLPMDRFRPNLVISGTSAFEEDEWDEIKIGDVKFKVAKPCARCVLTTVNQNTGEAGKEPLSTLSTYRSTNNKILFGQNLIALNEGLIRAGDSVEVLSYK